MLGFAVNSSSQSIIWNQTTRMNHKTLTHQKHKFPYRENLNLTFSTATKETLVTEVISFA
jgi:hypothetical protein